MENMETTINPSWKYSIFNFNGRAHAHVFCVFVYYLSCSLTQQLILTSLKYTNMTPFVSHDILF